MRQQRTRARPSSLRHGAALLIRWTLNATVAITPTPPAAAADADADAARALFGHITVRR